MECTVEQKCIIERLFQILYSFINNIFLFLQFSVTPPSQRIPLFLTRYSLGLVKGSLILQRQINRYCLNP